MAARGHRVALPPRDEAVDTDVVYVCCARPMLIEGGIVLVEGVEVPGAAKWLRLESWVRARRLRPVRPNEDYVRYDDFVASLPAEQPQDVLAEA